MKAGSLEPDALGAKLLAHERHEGEPHVVLGPREQALLATMPWPHRRSEWLHGRRVAKEVLERGFGLDPARTEVLPAPTEAPEVWFDGARREDLVINISHTKRYAVAAASAFGVGVDVCDDEDGRRLPRIARRVMGDGEAEACGAFTDDGTQAAVWALKEAVLKLRIGGVFSPGARSVRVESLSPARVGNADTRVELFRLSHGAVAVAVRAG
ncbi:MAG: 4'-phosphopantetheinyl transferase superfamily protein [Myxococcaceae bacterium]|nr:4'-phosphopantetheinyl transferase superfamily protein [Myxococcaceae bacterium]